MANILEQIGSGLKTIGGIASPRVFEANVQQDQQFQQIKAQREQMLQQLAAAAVQNGSLAPEKFQMLAQSRGWEVPNIGPSMQTQVATRNMQVEQDTEALRKQIDAQIESQYTPPTPKPVVGEGAAVPGGAIAPPVEIDNPANFAAREADRAMAYQRSGNPRLVEEGRKIAADLRAEERAGKQAERNVQFVELPTGRTIGGKPEVQNYAVVGRNDDGTPKLAPQGKPGVKGSLVEINQPSATEFAKKFGGGVAERDIAKYDEAAAAKDGVSKVDALLDHLETSDAITGAGAEYLKQVERIRTLLFNSEKAGKRVSDTELLDAMLGSDVFPMIKSLGIGARGLDTPAEREFLRMVMSGTVPMNKQTLIKMAKIRRDIAERSVEQWNRRVKTIPAEALEGTGLTRDPIEIPKREKGPEVRPLKIEAIPEGKGIDWSPEEERRFQEYEKTKPWQK